MSDTQQQTIQWAIIGELEQQIIAWAEEKGIFEKSNPRKQFEKFMEEAGELSDAMTEFDGFFEGNGLRRNDEWQKTRDELLLCLKLELGDVLVTLALLAKMHNTSFAECMQLAYDKISKRTGKMIDGLFVKD